MSGLKSIVIIIEHSSGTYYSDPKEMTEDDAKRLIETIMTGSITFTMNRWIQYGKRTMPAKSNFSIEVLRNSVISYMVNE